MTADISSFTGHGRRCSARFALYSMRFLCYGLRTTSYYYFRCIIQYRRIMS